MLNASDPSRPIGSRIANSVSRDLAAAYRPCPPAATAHSHSSSSVAGSATASGGSSPKATRSVWEGIGTRRYQSRR